MNVAVADSKPQDSVTAAVSIVHDLRNPLATIHGGAEMLAREGLSPTQIRRLARNVYSASIRMGELLEEFLDRSRGGDFDKRPTELSALVGCAVDTIATIAEFQCVRIAQDVTGSLIVDLDRRRNTQVERWFGELTSKRIRRGSFQSVADLKAAIDDFLTTWNENPKPFLWTATVDSIVAKLSRCKQTLEQIQPGCTAPRTRKTKK